MFPRFYLGEKGEVADHLHRRTGLLLRALVVPLHAVPEPGGVVVRVAELPAHGVLEERELRVCLRGAQHRLEIGVLDLQKSKEGVHRGERARKRDFFYHAGTCPWTDFIVSARTHTPAPWTASFRQEGQRKQKAYRDDFPATLFGKDGVEGGDVLVDLVLVRRAY